MRKTLLRAALGAVALAGATALMAGTATATAPTAGVACAPDGKISGRGATFALNAWNTFANGYREDVCGPVPGNHGNIATSTNNMSIYNYPGSSTGSGAGQRGISCRSDAFTGTDIPFDNATLANFNGAPGSVTPCPAAGTGLFAGAYPNASDQPGTIMSFPVAGSSVVVSVQLPAAFCTLGPRPTSLSFTASMVDRLFGGTIQNWNDPALRAGGVNANLANCPGPVTRFVRADRSGTTQIFKNYLDSPTVGSATCDPAETWAFLALDAQNQNWPTGPGCSALNNANSGNQALATACNSSTNGGAVCYLDLADAITLAPSTIRASVRNATDTSFVSPSVGTTRANCNFSSVTVPGGSPAGAVNLEPTDTWSFDNAAGNRSDVTQAGPGYPICGVTFALVYSAINDGTVPNAQAQLNANQRRTLYSFISWALTSAGQDRLNTQRYSSLPTTLANSIRSGFQAGF